MKIGLMFLWATALLPLADSEIDSRGLLRPASPRWLTLVEARAIAGYGHQSNPQTDPVGGGEGYSRVVTRGDFVTRTYQELQAALQRAQPGQVVFVPGDAALDFSGRPTLVIPTGVTIASDRGHGASPGALLYSDELETSFLLEGRGDSVRITGLRIRGPFDETWRVPFSSRGVRVGGVGAEIDNCEISAFSHQAVSAGGFGAYIHHNFIHHNQRGGLGYGVSVGGGHVFIEANHFDYNRHDIAGGGGPGRSYAARFNLVGPHSISHHFDMHGGRDRGDGTDIAGDLIHIHHNTFMGSGRAEIGIRGVPSQGAWIHNNWFVNPAPGTHIFIDGNGHVFDNAAGPDQQPFSPNIENRALGS